MKVQAGTLTRYRVHFHCEGLDEVRELSAIDAAHAKETVERSFPPGSGWYVTKVEPINPNANLQAPPPEAKSVPFPVGL